MASTTLDFPQPFGPTMAVIPGRKLNPVLSTKLLNPVICSDLIRNRPSTRAVYPRWASGDSTRRRGTLGERKAIDSRMWGV